MWVRGVYQNKCLPVLKYISFQVLFRKVSRDKSWVGIIAVKIYSVLLPSWSVSG